MVPEIPQEELSAALDSVAAEAIDRSALAEPPVDAVRVAQALGLTVVWDDRQAGRARRATVGGGAGIACVFVRHDPRPEREHWAVAHEIGESLANIVFEQLGIEPQAAPNAAREFIANALAGRILLPREWFQLDASACGWNLPKLKDRYATASHELIARRMLDFSTPVIVSIYDNNRLTWRKSNLEHRTPKASSLEIEKRREAFETGQAIVVDGPPRIQVWPVHEPGWKREIVRVEIDEFLE